jgi:hypothetical protein
MAFISKAENIRSVDNSSRLSNAVNTRDRLRYAAAEREAGVRKKVPYKKSKEMDYTAGFQDFCIAGNCDGWKTDGKYYTLTMPDGTNKMIMEMVIRAPKSLASEVNRA